MSGAGISEFALKVVPNLVENILQQANCQRNDISYFVFHQANNFMLQFLQQKCDLTGYPYWNNVREYGNTVSNSIPLALYDLTMEKPINQLSNTMLVGFGVGLSWAGCLTDLSQLHVSRD